jgi:uncharacterized protein YqhQ
MSKLNYGGQAVMEGVMMRGQHVSAVCVRNPAGEIVVHRQPLPASLYRGRIARWPFVRGLLMLWDSLGLGLRALTWSADVALSEEEDVSFSGPLAWGTVALSLALGIGLFFLLPMFLVSLLDRLLPSPLLGNLAEGAVRLGFFLAYLWAIGQMPGIVAQYPKEHTRCGTSFLLIVMILFVLISTLIGRPPLALRLLSRIVLIPLVAGISYEVIKLLAKYSETHSLARVVIAPGLAVQRLTTREPSPDMLEVSIQALKEVLASEGLLAQENGAVEAPTGKSTAEGIRIRAEERLDP